MFKFISKFESEGKYFFIIRTKGGVSILTEWEYRKVWGTITEINGLKNDFVGRNKNANSKICYERK